VGHSRARLQAAVRDGRVRGLSPARARKLGTTDGRAKHGSSVWSGKQLEQARRDLERARLDQARRQSRRRQPKRRRMAAAPVVLDPNRSGW
jgi:hypothetical protein